MDVKLKERLVGALVIIALAVLVLPVVFDDDKGETSLDSRIPDAPAGEPVRVITLSRPRPLDEIQPEIGQIAADTRSEEVSAGKPVFEAVVPDAGVDSTETAAADGANLTPPAQAGAADTAVGQVADAPVPANPAQANPAQSNSGQGNTVQGNTALADSVPAKTSDKNSEKASAGKPAATTTSTEKVASKPAGAVASGNPIPAAAKPGTATGTPSATAPVPRLPEAVGGFVVQAGLFSSPEGAKRVEQQLRTAGLKAYLRREKQDGKTLIRVLVGPIGSRAEADAVKARMKAAQVDGMVAAYDPLKH